MMKARPILEALGAGLVFMLPFFQPLLLPGYLVAYHHHLPLRHLMGALLLDWAAVSGLVLALILLMPEIPQPARRVAAACLAGVACWRTVGDVAIVVIDWSLGLHRRPEAMHTGDTFFAAWSRSTHWVAAALILLLAVMAWLKPEWSRLVVRLTRLGLASVAFFSLWVVPQLVRLMIASPETHAFSRPASPVPPDRRIIWVLFDELSFDLVFDHSPQPFPNFRGLRGFSFSNLQPAGFATERIIPSLFTGLRIDDIRSTPNGTLLYRAGTDRAWIRYDPANSLFAIAARNGWNAAIAGWYNPYCRTFASFLAACSWQPGIQNVLPIEVLGGSEDKGVLTNALAVPRASLLHVAGRGGQNRELSAPLAQDIADYQSIMDEARGLIANHNLHFIFLHLPIPHPPGIYDRATHRFRQGGNYLDNLTLADDTMGALLHQIDVSSSEPTTLIVSSDHSWRVPLWRPLRGWTPEEEQLTHGHFDQRPVLLIRFPGQNSCIDVSAPLPELMEYEIIAAMLENPLTGPEELKELIAAHAAKQKPIRASVLRR